MKHFFRNATCTELFIVDEKMGTVERLTEIGRPDAQVPSDPPHSELRVDRTGKKNRRQVTCTKCGGAGHNKTSCDARTAGSSVAKSGSKNGNADDLFIFDLTFEQADQIAEDTDTLKGDELKDYLKEHGLTPTALYNIRKKVSEHWQEKNRSTPRSEVDLGDSEPLS